MKKLVSLMLSIVMMMSIFAVSSQSFAAEYTSDSDAKAMLTLVNDFRASSDAWYWNVDNTPTKTTLKNLAAYKYDVNLEAIAKIRAEEISRGTIKVDGKDFKCFSHTRPDGSMFYDCKVKDAEGKELNSWGENIACGTGMTYEGAFNSWREDFEEYSNKVWEKQGHRRNMLSPDFTCIGIAGFKADDGKTYWVQEFGYSLSAQKKVVKKANTLKASAKKVTVKYSKLKKKNQTINVGKAMTVSNAKGTVSYKKSSGNGKITINKKTGKITVKKGLKKGTYKVKIKVTAAGNATYKAATKTVTVKIKVK